MAVETTKKALPDASAFDTLKYARNLKRDGGISEKQADAHAEGLQVALRGVAKGSDILALKYELKSDIKVLKADIKVLLSELKADIKVVEARLTTIERRLDDHLEQMRDLQRMMMIGFSINGGLILLMGLLLVLK